MNPRWVAALVAAGAVVMTGCGQDGPKRYDSAHDMHKDVQRYAACDHLEEFNLGGAHTSARCMPGGARLSTYLSREDMDAQIARAGEFRGDQKWVEGANWFIMTSSKDERRALAKGLKGSIIDVKGAPVPPIELAAEECGMTEHLRDEGQSIQLSTGADLSSQDRITFGDIWCVMQALGAPDHLREHIVSTRALDGQQTATWDGFNARWTYHPKAGLNVTIWEG